MPTVNELRPALANGPSRHLVTPDDYRSGARTQIDPRWQQSGWGYRVSGVDELTRAIGRIGTLQTGRRYVWRGVADHRWRVRSALFRMLAEEIVGESSGPDEAALRARERALLREARSWGLGLGSGGFVDDIHLLATLQHHGIPTRLLDVTSNPMTALWFACQKLPPPPGRASEVRDAAGALFAFDVADLDEHASLRPSDNTWGSQRDGLGWPLQRALEVSSETGAPFLIRPSLPDSRMQAQEGLFITGAVPASPAILGLDGLGLSAGPPPGSEKLAVLFGPTDRGVGRPTRLPFCVLLISPDVKAKMRPHLETTYNRSDRVLFPDVAGMVASLKAGRLDLSDPTVSD